MLRKSCGNVPPAPRWAVGENASNQRTNDARDAIGSPDDSSESRPLLRRHDEGDDDVAAGKHTGSPEADDGASHDESHTVLCNSCATVRTQKRRGWGRVVAPQMRLPISNMATLTRNTFLRSRNL